MLETSIKLEEIAALAVLTNGIIPPDNRDAGAASVDAGPRIAQLLARARGKQLYFDGLNLASKLSVERYSKALGKLSPSEVADLLGAIRELNPPFFRQLRTDTCALYLSAPEVWQRIGFPGPSAPQGGYPDCDKPPKESHSFMLESSTDRPRSSNMQIHLQDASTLRIPLGRDGHKPN